MKPASDSMVVVAMAMPNRPAELIGDDDADDDHQRRQRRWIPGDMARPWMTLVPWPETEALAIDFTGRKLVPV